MCKNLSRTAASVISNCPPPIRFIAVFYRITAPSSDFNDSKILPVVSLGITIRQCRVIGTEFKRECNALFALGHLAARIDIKQRNLTQKCPATFADTLRKRGDRYSFVTDDSNIPGNCRKTRQRRITALFGAGSPEQPRSRALRYMPHRCL